MSETPLTRLDELALDRSCQGLWGADAVEFERLLRGEPDYDAESFERAAAAAHLSLVRPHEVGASLRDRLIADGESIVDQLPVRVLEPTKSERPESSGVTVLAWMGWAAALLLLLFGGPASTVEFTPTELREALIARATDELVLDWATTEDPSARGASGDVVWSSAEQAGFMTIRGLATNDPSKEQYQLWIFDGTRTEGNSVTPNGGVIPVDGGVFDVTDGEVVVPIDAKLPVGEATLFAITVEKPGGVSVSRQERIVLAASVP